ncbi:MAG: 4Fe-4S binding protein [Sedimentisphaerales bacterium]|nr:4Fe-4S binding protein [Sedimentisphaerales bacterium]
MQADTSYIRTIKDRCRLCYTCVRECPAKAIRIVEGQAEIIPERCINCGNCVRVCSQNAKQVVSSIPQVESLLDGSCRVAACVAPSFPAEFSSYDYQIFVGMLRSLGFDIVHEVAFGADLVANQYYKLLAASDGKKRYISTPCPAIISYVEKYFPELVNSLAPIVSPMIASARALRVLHGRELKIVFIGPCIAKKCEAGGEQVIEEINEVLTFAELRTLFAQRRITADTIQPSDFDPPYAGLGTLFPISRGLLQAADIPEDLISGSVVTTDGRSNFVEAVKEFADGDLDAKFLEVLCCNGCIMGAGMTTTVPLFNRRGRVSAYARRRLQDPARKRPEDLSSWDTLNLSRSFVANDQRLRVPFEEEISQIMARMGKFQLEDELNCGACGYDTCREHAIAIFKGLAESEMCLPYTIEQLRNTINELGQSNEQLRNTQAQLMQSEKLASMGQLAAGIAHEVNNPLGVVLMYAHLLLEQHGNNPQLKNDLQMVVDQADRCKKIVAGLLHFARQNKVVLQRIDMSELLDRVVKTTYLPPTISIHVMRQVNDAAVDIDPDQMIQVFSNLINNAQSAMPNGGRLTLGVAGDDATLEVRITDTGVGIPRENLAKLFEPFFTTKQVGSGTGLGLAVTYGIIKMHRGDIRVESNADRDAGPTGTTFIIRLPRRGQNRESA